MTKLCIQFVDIFIFEFVGENDQTKYTYFVGKKCPHNFNLKLELNFNVCNFWACYQNTKSYLHLYLERICLFEVVSVYNSLKFQYQFYSIFCTHPKYWWLDLRPSFFSNSIKFLITKSTLESVKYQVYAYAHTSERCEDVSLQSSIHNILGHQFENDY